MKRARWASPLALALAYGAIVWTVLGAHPALAGAGKLSAQARSLAADARALRGKMALWIQLDPLSGLAMAALEMCALLLCLNLLHVLRRARGIPAGVEPVGQQEGKAPRLLAAALLGHVAGCVAASLGGDASRYYLWCSGTLAALLGISLCLEEGDARRAAGSRMPGGRARAAVTALAGAALVFASSPIDTMAALVSGSPLFPEAWFPLSVMWLSGESTAAVTLSAGLLFLAVFAVERWKNQGGDADLPGMLSTAPAYAFLLGPSNPFKALATAFVLARLGRLGSSALERTLFVLLTVVIPVALVTRSGS